MKQAMKEERSIASLVRRYVNKQYMEEVGEPLYACSSPVTGNISFGDPEEEVVELVDVESARRMQAERELEEGLQAIVREEKVEAESAEPVVESAIESESGQQ